MSASTLRKRFTEAELQTLRSEFSTLERMDPRHLPRFHALFDGLTLPALRQLVGARIAFVSSLARNAVMRREGKMS